jgi:hypothetical protein
MQLQNHYILAEVSAKEQYAFEERSEHRTSPHRE